MLEVVALGVAGVLQSHAALWTTEIHAAERFLQERGHRTTDLASFAFDAYRDSVAAPLDHALRAAGIVLQPALRSALEVEVRSAVPPAPRLSPRASLLTIRRTHRLALLDVGAKDRMERWIASLGIADLPARCVWTEDLGLAARPPRPLAFRWLADRLEARPSQCLYVAGSPALGAAAFAAGWRVAGGVRLDADSSFDFESLWAALDDVECSGALGS